MTEKKTATPATGSDDELWGEEGGSIQMNYPNFEKPGDYVLGVYVEKRKNDTPDKWGHINTEYILVHPVTQERTMVSGRAYPGGDKTKHRVLFGMSDIPLGAFIKIQFTEERDNDKGNPTKIITPFYKGEKKLDILASYRDKFTTEVEELDTTVPADTTTNEKGINVEEIPFD